MPKAPKIPCDECEKQGKECEGVTDDEKMEAFLAAVMVGAREVMPEYMLVVSAFGARIKDGKRNVDVKIASSMSPKVLVTALKYQLKQLEERVEQNEKQSAFERAQKN